ncbi:MAG: hypothetical protein NZ534_03850 [Bacteroidia bacterium]|nr:hypothetical protein [Bacteroidia bacterium]
MKLWAIITAVTAAACFAGCDGRTPKSDVRDTLAVARDTTPPFDPGPIDRYWNDLARLLAGLTPDSGSVLSAQDSSPAAEGHRRFFESAWQSKTQSFIAPLSEWAETEIAHERKTAQTVLYPFSGADALTIHTLFPDAPRYILFGLEPEGNPPPISALSLAALPVHLRNLQVALDDILVLSYFKTIDMQTDFRRGELNGVLPVLLAFLARRGNRILWVERGRISPEGLFDTTGVKSVVMNPDDTLVTGLRIRFQPQNQKNKVQDLFYFSVNVDNGRIPQAFRRLLAKHDPVFTYIKSASYLMYYPSFSIIRTHLLDYSRFVLQEDSGMPLSSFDRNVWDLKFYGAYTRPIPLFANRFQPELYKIYQTDTTIKPLKFGIGYNHIPGTSNLMAARKKNDELRHDPERRASQTID